MQQSEKLNKMGIRKRMKNDKIVRKPFSLEETLLTVFRISLVKYIYCDMHFSLLLFRYHFLHIFYFYIFRKPFPLEETCLRVFRISLKYIHYYTNFCLLFFFYLIFWSAVFLYFPYFNIVFCCPFTKWFLLYFSLQEFSCWNGVFLFSVTLRVPILNWEVQFMKNIHTYPASIFAEDGNKHIRMEGFQSPCLMRNEAV